MKKLENNGMMLIIIVSFLSLIFLIMHSFELPFQEYPYKMLLNILRFAFVIILLIFIYSGNNWARLFLGIIFFLLFIGGIVGIIFFTEVFFGSYTIIYITMMICSFLIAYFLLFSKAIKAFIKR